MSRFIVLALFVSAFVVFGTMGTSFASPQTEDSNILIKCSTCGVEFSSEAATEQHVKGHPDHELSMPAQPLIKCSTCGVEFTSEVSLKKHLQVNHEHKGEPLIKCSTCGVEFTSPGLLKEHMKKHSDS